MNEASIIINGVRLSIGQSMALRVAIGHFRDNMETKGLGNTPEGKAMAQAYADRSSEIERLIVAPLRTAGLKQCEASGGHNDCHRSAFPGSRYCLEHSRDPGHWHPLARHES